MSVYFSRISFSKRVNSTFVGKVSLFHISGRMTTLINSTTLNNALGDLSAYVNVSLKVSCLQVEELLPLVQITPKWALVDPMDALNRSK